MSTMSAKSTNAESPAVTRSVVTTVPTLTVTRADGSIITTTTL